MRTRLFALEAEALETDERDDKPWHPLKLAAWAFAFTVVGLLLYRKTLDGLPIWDDIAFWFDDPTLTGPDFWRLKTIAHLNWPLTAIYQHVSYRLWGFDFSRYHMVNIALHLTNSILVYLIALRLKWRRAPWIAAIFLIHPACAIAVGWMIQFKTLFCAFLACASTLSFIVSLQSLEEVPHRVRWLAASVVLFTLSLLAKTASAPLVVLFAWLAVQRIGARALLWLTPFALIAAVGSARLLTNPLPNDARQTAVEGAEAALDAPVKLQRVTETLSYYAAQSFLPTELYPVKGRARADFDWNSWFCVFALSLIVLVLFRTRGLLLFGAGVVMLTPFLGVIQAPFMSVSWVSDQHLYLALPLFIACFVEMFERSARRTPLKIATVLLVIWSIFLVYQTSIATRFYDDEVTFFKASLAAEPDNLAVANNLAISYIRMNKLGDAFDLLNGYVVRSETSPKIQRDPYYPTLLELRTELRFHDMPK
jgi:4-amino-4-deoxy-L-arabinose transferase-like glycosyltransferase